MTRAGTKLYDGDGHFVAEVTKDIGDACQLIQFEGSFFVRKNATQFQEMPKLRVYNDEVRRL